MVPLSSLLALLCLTLSSNVQSFQISTWSSSSSSLHITTRLVRGATPSSAPDTDTTSTATTELSDDEENNVEQRIANAKTLLYRAAETKSEDSDAVVDALLDLEKLMRQRNKADPTLAEQTLQALSGNGGASWRLIFTTGTINTQQKTGRRINYFPLKATQSFKSDVSNDDGNTPWLIENGIYLGDFPAIKFRGDFDWTLQKSGVTKLTFDFTSLQLFGTFDVTLKAGQAANLGAKSGLGSENNVQLIEQQGKRAFFNWISADEQIATARGGGGGLALWKKVDYEGGK